MRLCIKNKNKLIFLYLIFRGKTSLLVKATNRADHAFLHTLSQITGENTFSGCLPIHFNATWQSNPPPPPPPPFIISDHQAIFMWSCKHLSKKNKEVLVKTDHWTDSIQIKNSHSTGWKLVQTVWMPLLRGSVIYNTTMYSECTLEWFKKWKYLCPMSFMCVCIYT